MSFANEPRADPRQHFRTEPGFRPPHDHSAGLTEGAVKSQLVTPVRWELFKRWMWGQTIGLCPRGCSLYYQSDVDAFMANGKVYD